MKLISQTIDQGCDFEVLMLSGPVLQKMMAHFAMVEGDSPFEQMPTLRVRTTKCKAARPLACTAWGPHAVSAALRELAVERPPVESRRTLRGGQLGRPGTKVGVFRMVATPVTLDRYASECRARALQRPDVLPGTQPRQFQPSLQVEQRMISSM